MNERFKTLFTDRIISGSVLLSILFLVLFLGIVVLAYHNLPPLIPIYNQMPWGVGRIASRVTIFLPFTLGLGILVLNTTIASFFYQKYALVSRMISLSAFVTISLSFLFLLRTLIVVFF
jgi:Ni/Fe-hydrogenase subunit HybB-like protein